MLKHGATFKFFGVSFLPCLIVSVRSVSLWQILARNAMIDAFTH